MTERQSVRAEGRGISKSMIAFTLAVLGVLALAIQTWLPGLLGQDSGVHVTAPSLLQVDEAARGTAVLAHGVNATLYGSGLRISDRDGVLLDTVLRGSPISVATGSVSGSGGRRVEHLGELLSVVRITRLDSAPERARYLGTVSDGGTSLPLTLEVAASPGGVVLTARVEGADEVIWHLAADYDVRGYPPALPERNLRNRAWWLKGSAQQQPDFTSMRGADIAIRPDGTPRAIDLRENGRIDVHVWSATSSLVLARRAVATRTADE